MPITTSNPPLDAENREYPNLLVSVAITGRPVPGGVAASVALKAQPYRVDENGEVVLHGTRRSLSLADAFELAETDPALAEAAGYIMAGIQMVVTHKGL